MKPCLGIGETMLGISETSYKVHLSIMMCIVYLCQINVIVVL